LSLLDVEENDENAVKVEHAFAGTRILPRASGIYTNSLKKNRYSQSLNQVSEQLYLSLFHFKEEP
jgi:hypothetical protein